MRRLVFESNQDNGNTVARVVYSPASTPYTQRDRTRRPRRPSTYLASECRWVSREQNPSKKEFSRTNAYIYEPLPGKSFIRCLELAPGKASDHLRGRLKVIRLSRAKGAFEAISYAWGSTEKNQIIIVDGKAMAITTSLRDALHQARRLEEPRLLWADAICINQEDSEEKGHQVMLMGQIYKTSRCTLICLGYSTEMWPHEAEALIRDVNQMMHRVFRFYIGDNQPWDNFPHPKADDRLICDERWRSWNALTSQPWFRRGWVVQEAALGPDCLVLLADKGIAWLSILKVGRWISYRSSHMIRIHGRQDNVSSAVHELSLLHSATVARRRPEEIKTLVQRPEEGATSPYMELTALKVLHLARGLHIKDPKDRVYAFMEYPTSDRAMVNLQPRYGTDTSHLDVYREFATKYLEQNSDLDILRFVEHDEIGEVAAANAIGDDNASGQVRSPSFPSWIPRWDCGAQVVPMGLIQDRRVEQYSQEFALLRGDSILQVKGVIIDSVKYVSKKIERTDQPVEAVATVVSLWNDFAEASAKYPGPHHNRLGVVFLHTMCLTTYSGEAQIWTQALEAFGNLLQSDSPGRPMRPYTRDPNAQLFSTHGTRISHNRRFFILSRGYRGISSLATRQGDACAVIFGTCTPFILRKVTQKSDHYVLVGPAYVQSAETDDFQLPYRMGEDEYCDDWKDWDLPSRDLFLC